MTSERTITESLDDLGEVVAAAFVDVGEGVNPVDSLKAIVGSIEDLTNAVYRGMNHDGGSGDISIAASLFEIPYQWIETNRYLARIATALETIAEES